MVVRGLGFLLLISLFCNAYAINNTSNIAFFYENNVPANALHAFDIVVVDPDTKLDPKAFNTKNSKAYAYVSVGEITKLRAYFKDVKKSWLVGRNKAWDSYVVDQSNPEWRAFFIKRIIKPLWDQGFRGFFFDTLDSFNLATKTKQQQQEQTKGLVQLIRDVKQAYPSAKLIFNRGFEIIPEVHPYVDAVVAESLFAGWDPLKKRYTTVSNSDRQYLLAQLDKLKAYNLPIVIIDYEPPVKREAARKVAAKIRKLGYIPWVTDYNLSSLGVGNIEVIPRDILVIYDDPDSSQMGSEAFRMIAMPLEQMGLVPHFHRINKPLPQGVLKGRYAGVVVWLNSNNTGTSNAWQRWLGRQLKEGMRFAFFNHFGVQANNVSLAPLGLKFVGMPDNLTQRATIEEISPLFGYEADALADPHNFVALHVIKGTPLLVLSNDRKQLGDMAAFTPWGGYVLAPYAVTLLPNEQSRWVIDPFKFLKQALALPDMPIPDVTTENGRRLLITHIDGDGFISRAEWYQGPYAGQVMDEEILQKYQIPTTVSIIQGEIAKNGLYSKASPDLENIARNIFKYPWVEIASHTYSHPYKWRIVEQAKTKALQDKYSLAIPRYRFSLDKEITGSIDYINQKLAPKGKICKVMLWSGDTDPSKQALELCDINQVKNMNGGNTTITHDSRSITNIAPLGVRKNSHFQVFAPNQNENVYTNLWRGPFYGYQRVIETFKLTDKPHRYKPINIYYHFYSATKRASLEALHKVYAYALSQPTLPLFASEYIDKVLAYNQIIIAKKADGGWLIRNNASLRELRVPQTWGYPDLEHSKNVIGYRDYNKDRYVHLGLAKQSLLKLNNKLPTKPYLREANSQIQQYDYDAENERIAIQFNSYVPLQLSFANATNCVILNGNTPIARGNMDVKNIVLSHKDLKVIRVRCSS